MELAGSPAESSTPAVCGSAWSQGEPKFFGGQGAVMDPLSGVYW